VGNNQHSLVSNLAAVAAGLRYELRLGSAAVQGPHSGAEVEINVPASGCDGRHASVAHPGDGRRSARLFEDPRALHTMADEPSARESKACGPKACAWAVLVMLGDS